MLSFKSFLFTSLLVNTVQAERFRYSRLLSQESIAGFSPQTSVTDHNSIDLDQKALEEQVAKLTELSFDDAERIYREGGNSKSYAELQITDGLPTSALKGQSVTGTTATGQTVVGTVYEDASQGAGTLKVQYKTSEVQSDYVDCQVGGLVAINTEGCFAQQGTVNLENVGSALAYTYTPEEDNKNGRTIQGFSTGADIKMRENESSDGAYYPTFSKFEKYYGSYMYADTFILGALNGQAVSLNGKSFNFNDYGYDGRAEAAKKGTAYMAIAMYALREMEDAIDDCLKDCATDECNSDAVSALDEGVAFYTGSLEGTTGDGAGVLMYGLADKRCENFKTCGPDGTSLTGTSKVNIDIFREFDRMQNNLLTKQCIAARRNKEEIEKKMFVPLVQGTLRYAYVTNTQPDYTEKAEAEGATFAAAVLPVVAACSESDAATIYENMKPGAGGADFQVVKRAFENNYKCMGISCADVGGLYNDADMKYFDGAKPCGGVGSSSSNNDVNVGLAVGLSIAAVAVLAIAFILVKRRRSAPEVEFKSESMGNHGSPQV